MVAMSHSVWHIPYLPFFILFFVFSWRIADVGRNGSPRSTEESLHWPSVFRLDWNARRPLYPDWWYKNLPLFIKKLLFIQQIFLVEIRGLWSKQQHERLCSYAVSSLWRHQVRAAGLARFAFPLWLPSFFLHAEREKITSADIGNQKGNQSPQTKLLPGTRSLWKKQKERDMEYDPKEKQGFSYSPTGSKYWERRCSSGKILPSIFYSIESACLFTHTHVYIYIWTI